MYYFDLLEKLYQNDIKYLIVGGLAVNLYNVPRLTQDIDIVISMDRSNVTGLISVLRELGYLPRLTVDPEDLANPDKLNDRIENNNMKAFSFYNKTDNCKVVDIVLVHPLDFERSFENRTVKKVNDIELYLASLDDVIKTNEFSGRPQDLCDVKMLKKALLYMGEG